MERPIISISSKNFLTGIAPSAHIDNSGLFLKALGVTPVYDPGGTESVENGLLQAGSSPTDFTGGVVVDNIFASAETVGNSPIAYFLGENGHLYQKYSATEPIIPNSISDLRSGTPITNAANGLMIFQPVGGSKVLLYWRRQNIGTWDLSGTYPTGWSDSAISGLTTTLIHRPHRFYDRIYYPNAAYVGKIYGSAGAIASTPGDLNLPANSSCTAVSDDGVYLVIAITDNLVGSDSYGGNTRVLFWDTNSSSWQREYPVNDPFIISLTNLGNGVVRAVGQYGIYDIVFGVGAKKILGRTTGFGTTTDLAAGYGTSRAAPFGPNALIFGVDASLDSIGKLAPELPYAYHKPFKVPAGAGAPTLVDTEFEKGRVYMGTKNAKLYAFDFDAATRTTGVSAQTIYFPLPEPFLVHRIDAIFGEPLSSGDAFDIDTKVDEDTAAVDFDSVSYAVEGAIRRKSMFADKAVRVDEQLSLVCNFTGGNVKLKKIEVYGTPLEPITE